MHYNVVPLEPLLLLDYIMFYLLIFILGIITFIALEIAHNFVVWVIRLNRSSRNFFIFAVFFFLFYIVLITLLSLISDLSLFESIANDSVYGVCSPLEPSITGRALKVVGCTALVVWGYNWGSRGYLAYNGP